MQPEGIQTTRCAPLLGQYSCEYSWLWFVEVLMKGININDGEGWVFTLDHQQKGLILAINDQVSKARQNIGCMPVKILFFLSSKC